MDRQARWILGFWLLFNLLQSAVTELFHDEAYYRVFSRFPDWGYKDHPPVTALLVAAGSELLPGEMGVRLFMVLLTATTLWMARCMVQPDRPLLFWSILLSMPLVHVLGFLAVPDAPLLFGSMLFFMVWKRFLERTDLPSAMALAAVLTFLAYTKYHGALLFLFALLPHPRLLRRREFWAACLLTGAALLPHLIWQFDHDWLSFRYHLRDRAGDAWKFRFVYEYLAGQIALWGPFTSVLLWIAVFRFGKGSPFELSLRSVAAGFLIFFFYQSWRQPTEANWTAPVFLPLLWLGYHYLKERPRAGRWVIGSGLTTLLLLVVLRVWMAWDFVGLKRAMEFHHWKEWTSLVEELAGDVPVVFLDRYQLPSKFAFYSGRKTWCQTTNTDTGSQYDLLYALEEAVQGERVCIVKQHPKPGFDADTIVKETPVGRPLGLRWEEDFRSYNRIRCDLLSPQREFPRDTLVLLPVRIVNPTDRKVTWDTTGARAVTFEYVFILKDRIQRSGLALTEWPVTSLEPGQSVETMIALRTPVAPARYRLRLAWRVKGLFLGKNSGYYYVDVRDDRGKGS